MNKEIFSKKLYLLYVFILLATIWFFIEPALKSGHISFGGHSGGIVFIFIFGMYVMFATVIEILSPLILKTNMLEKELEISKSRLITALLVGNIISIIIMSVGFLAIFFMPFLFILVPLFIKSWSLKYFSKKVDFGKAIRLYFPILLALFLIPFAIIIGGVIGVSIFRIPIEGMIASLI